MGAAKSGTNSLYHYLKQHPGVSLNEGQKESRFFTNVAYDKMLAGPKDASMSHFPKTVEEYKELYKNATNSTMGEVSPDYLYFHEKTIPKIKEILGDIKIIIILRNPVERAFSSYMHLIRDGRETLSFSDGLDAEEKRTDDKYWFIWYYKQAGLYYKQVNDFINNFTDVEVYLYDDLKSDSDGLMMKIFDFIGVDKTFQPDTSKVHNTSGEPKNRMINRFLIRDNKIKTFFRPIIKSLHIYPTVIAVMDRVRKVNSKNFRKTEMDKRIRGELIEYYREDIIQLGKLINRDLSNWLK